jgi:hypothetical protein
MYTYVLDLKLAYSLMHGIINDLNLAMCTLHCHV